MTKSHNIAGATQSKCCEPSELGLRTVGQTQPELEGQTLQMTFSVATRGRSVENEKSFFSSVGGRMPHHPRNFEACKQKDEKVNRVLKFCD